MKASLTLPIKLLSVCCIAIFLFLMPTKPADAGIGACLAAAESSLDLAQLALEKAPKIAACAGQLASGGPAGVGVTGVIAGLFALDQFNTEEQCNNLIPTKITEALAELLEEVPEVANFLATLVGKGTIDNFLKMVADGAAAQLMSVDALQPVFGFLTCGCTMIGGAAEIVQAALEAGQDAVACGEFIGEALEDVAELFFGDDGERVATNAPCDANLFVCKPGQTKDECLSKVKLLKQYDSQCPAHLSCTNPQNPKTKNVQFAKGYFQGTKGYNQTEYCPCRKGEGVYLGSCIACAGVAGKELLPSGECRTWKCEPKEGVKFVGYGKAYLQCNYDRLCDIGTVWDGKTKSCTACAEDTFSAYPAQNPRGVCNRCAWGTTSAAGSGKCEALTCAEGTEIEPTRGNSCRPCQGGTIAGKVVCTGKFEGSLCPKGQVLLKGRCQDELGRGTKAVQPPQIKPKADTAKSYAPEIELPGGNFGSQAPSNIQGPTLRSPGAGGYVK